MEWLKLFVTLTFVVTIETKIDLTLKDVKAVVGEKFDYQIGDDEFLSKYRIYRIVERGEKRLPQWLHFDANYSMLMGYPEPEDAGSYTLRLRAKCVDQEDSDCQDRLSRTFNIFVVEPLKSAESRAAPDEAPALKNSIDHIKVSVGRYYQFRVPENTFQDKEDGNTRNLSLSVSLVYGKPLPSDSWLMFDRSSQTLYGIPLKSDTIGPDVLNKIILTAKDSEGQTVKDAISLTYQYEKELNHIISMRFISSFEEFMTDRENLVQFARSVAGFYGDNNLAYLTFSNVDKGSVIVAWSNTSLLGSMCRKSVIQELYDRLVDVNDTRNDSNSALFRDFKPLSYRLEFSGSCLLPLTSSLPPTKSPVTDGDDRLWLEIILPALIAILVVVIIALLLLICCRHRRPSKSMKDSDKPAFLEDRRPIIFPEELELVDPSLRSKTPLVLPSDYLHDSRPTVPPHGRPAPPYKQPEIEDLFPEGDNAPPPPPPHTRVQDPEGTQSDPPPYRLPPPYFNPHRPN